MFQHSASWHLLCRFFVYFTHCERRSCCNISAPTIAMSFSCAHRNNFCVRVEGKDLEFTTKKLRHEKGRVKQVASFASRAEFGVRRRVQNALGPLASFLPFLATFSVFPLFLFLFWFFLHPIYFVSVLLSSYPISYRSCSSFPLKQPSPLPLPPLPFSLPSPGALEESAASRWRGRGAGPNTRGTRLTDSLVSTQLREPIFH